MLGPIEKAIQKSDLGLNPQNDGKLIRLAVPELTGDRRKELVRTVHKEGETGKVAIRTIRREYNEMVKEMEKDKEISEDESRRLQAKVQEVTDKAIGKLDEALAVKEKEITEV
jgi:ribosome recycling factor